MQKLPEEEKMISAPLSLSKTMKSNKRSYFFSNEQIEIDEQELLFLDKSTHLHAFSDNNNSILELGYNKFSLHIAQYLIILPKLSSITVKKYWKFKNHALYFQILDKHYFGKTAETFHTAKSLTMKLIDRKSFNLCTTKVATEAKKAHTDKWQTNTSENAWMMMSKDIFKRVNNAKNA